MHIPTEPTWVDDNETLRQLCERWSGQAAIAVDTEFMRSDTFYPIAGLIQVGDGHGCYLIDPQAITDFSPLVELWQNPGVTKVLHACSEDLEVFAVLLDALPAPLFDTQVAAAFAGCGYSLGYAGLVRELLGIEIPKGETRSDWLARPLSVAQTEYAALDVAHLLIVYGKLLKTLKEQGRLAWVHAECDAQIAAAAAPNDLSQAYLKAGLGWKLPPRGVAALQQLCLWREQEARARNIPRNRLLKEQPLYEIARRLPEDYAGLRRIEGIPKRTLSDDGDHLLQLVQQARELPESQLPTRMSPPLAREYGAAMKTMKAWVRERAEQIGLPPELLIRKKEYEHLVRSFAAGQLELPQRLTGWRYEVLGKDLQQVAERALQEVR
ncbi:ribonuclease D [Gilvimarinus xylanilyticus]|uniref:Ribonuclease D n=1 Tax=Gilvimarinus xylanilyticus TaxID=2944139 RepID=A0A9X2KTR0_9GAMM|nr:ribonuclease D [Gilvimarinus xylanilyticus]MCP8899038.1 ribonuclease D [Gilvimarinus xylanilyticus]